MSKTATDGYVLAEGFEHNHALVGAEAKNSRKGCGHEMTVVVRGCVEQR